MIEVIINQQVIPAEDIVKLRGTITDKMTGTLSSMLSASISIEIDNTNPTKYDPEYTNSFFYNDWYNRSISLFDASTGEMLFAGRLKNIEKKDSEGNLIITCKNFIRDIVDTDIVVPLGSNGTTTPSELIQTILVEHVGIDASYINANSFFTARNIQHANNVFLSLLYSKENAASANSIIQEICSITNSDLYIINNTIYYRQWVEYAGEVGENIIESDIIEGSYSTSFDSDGIYNDYVIAYKSGNSVAYASSDDSYESISKSLYGVRKYFYPSKEERIENVEDLRIALTNSAGANFCGDSIVQRNKWIKKICELLTTDRQIEVNIHDLVDLTKKPHNREPIRITQRQYNESNRQLTYSGEFINYLHGVDIDRTAPDEIVVIAVYQIAPNSVVVIWNPSLDPTIISYYLYFSTTQNWDTSVSSQGISPINISKDNVKISDDGYCYHILNGLRQPARYSFKVSCIDQRGNISADSNIITRILVGGTENKYRTTGNLWEGILVSDNNYENGKAPEDMRTWDSFYYDSDKYEYFAVYESSNIASQTLIDAIIFSCHSPSDTYGILQFRDFDQGSWSDWSTEHKLQSVISMPIQKKTIQLRYKFYRENWKDDINIRIREIIENGNGQLQ